MEKINQLIKKVIYDAVIVDKKDTNNFLKQHKDLIVKKKHVKPVQNKDNQHNYILINSKEEFQKQNDEKYTYEEFQITIKPSEMTYQEILEQILPSNVTVPSSFEMMGSIAMVYLKPNQIPHQKIIGEAILITNKTVKTVFNKSEKLNNIFRTPILDLIAGEDNKVVTLLEDGIRMKFNIDEVYFCSRLHSERKRVYKKYIQQNQIIADAFCGIGPFCLWAIKKNCTCYANDLNPQCYKFLKENIKLNKTKKIRPFCEDGGKFILNMFKEVQNQSIDHVDHFYMNLPALAITFVHNFQQVPEKMLNKGFYIHVYCFLDAEDKITQKNNVQDILTEQLQDFYKFVIIKEIHQVKNVSSKKSMLCVTFQMKKEEKITNKKLKVNQLSLNNSKI